MPDLAFTMKSNPKMKVMLAGGYYDLATPYFEGKFEMHHLPIPQKLQANISYHYYESGICVRERGRVEEVPRRRGGVHQEQRRRQVAWTHGGTMDIELTCRTVW